MVAAVVEERSPGTDPVTGWLRDVLDGLGAEFGRCRIGETADDAALIDQIALAEQIGSALAALKAAKMVRFREAQIAAQRADGRDPASVGRGIGEQVGLACHVSPTEGSRRLGRAWAWWHELPATFELMAQGRLSEWAAVQVATETRHLDSTTRRAVDRQLVGGDHIDRLGVRGVASRARARAYAADPDGYTERGNTERKHRRVGIRPAPDTMSWLSAYLAVEQGVACYAALRRATDAAKAGGDARSRAQIMADTLVERLTGQPSADAVDLDVHIVGGPGAPGPATPQREAGPDLVADGPTAGAPSDSAPHDAGPGDDGPLAAAPAAAAPAAGEPGSAALVLPGNVLDRLAGEGAASAQVQVQLLIPWVTLTGGNRPGVLVGHGPLPAPLVRELIIAAAGRVRIRVRPPDAGRSSRSRAFRGSLKQRIEHRDHTCRDPFCDAPIRHIDHITRWADGGATSYPNGRGVCERGNYIRELPGWTVRLIDRGTHTVEITTPTGHTYTSQPPQPP